MRCSLFAQLIFFLLLFVSASRSLSSLRYAWRDKKNEAQSDALIVFLVDRPLTGKGSLSTLNKFRTGKYAFVEIEKPRDADFLVVRGRKHRFGVSYRCWLLFVFILFDCAFNFSHPIGIKPCLIFWDIEIEKLARFSNELQTFVNKYKPNALMVAGSTAHTNPHVEERGAALFRRCWAT
jgi:hypothetical protein